MGSPPRRAWACRELLDRPGERRRLHAGRRHGVLRRFRHLHDPRRPGWERELPGSASGLAVLRRGIAGQTISFTSPPPSGVVTGGSTCTVTASAAPASRSPSLQPAPPCAASRAPPSCSCRWGRGRCSRTSRATAPTLPLPRSRSRSPSRRGADDHAHDVAAERRVRRRPTYSVDANASSGLAVVFSSGSPSVCSVSGSTVLFVASGTCVVRANEAGNASYQPAPQVEQSFTVVPPPSDRRSRSPRVRRVARSTSGRTTTSPQPRARFSLSASRCLAPARCRAPRRS